MTNSTISGNSVGTLGQPAQGGGIFNGSSGTVHLTNSTVSHNVAEEGGGISNYGEGGQVQIWNSIVADNVAHLGAPDVRSVFTAFTSLGHNLIGIDEGSKGFVPGTGNPNGDLVGTRASPIDPLLGPLANNGGATLTHLLQTGSLAINAGDNAAITNPPFSGPPFYDQRGTGFPRILNTTVDIGSVEVGPTVVTPAKALNISTRLRVETGNGILIGGFIITGTAPKSVAVRGVGPSLAQFGISDVLADPTVELRDSTGALVAQNDNWQDDPSQAAQLTALGLALQNPNESGLVATLDPGAYTALLAGKNNGTGVGLVEIYDANQAADSQLANISTRGFVQTGNDVMIGGFILGGSDTTHILIRGIGPSLQVLPVLADPTLELRDSNGALLDANDNCSDVVPGPLIKLGAFAEQSPCSSVRTRRRGMYG